MQVTQRDPAEPLWTAIGQTSNQLILYHPPSHALSVQSHAPLPTPTAGPSRPRQPLLLAYDPPTPTPLVQLCPYCSQALPSDSVPLSRDDSTADIAALSRTPYFRVLERAHEGSMPPSPRLRNVSVAPSMESDEDGDQDGGQEGGTGLGEDDGGSLPSKGYYERFFREERRLGMGAEGTVFLATHVIGGNVLGTYAVKKIAVGESKEYLIRMLREVRLLETLRHPNIIPYHHSWIEPTHFSAFGPPINALHVLMMYATAGNLDTFLLARTHTLDPGGPGRTAADLGDADSLGQLPREERIKAFKKRRASGVGRKEENRGVMMLGVAEVLRLFGDVVEGLAFLHSNSIVHLDLKCSNVLLHWEEGGLIPKALISDFGTSEELLLGQRQRTGHTGTMEYMAPETLVVDAKGQWRPTDSHADMWSLGMILHKLLFLALPYTATADFDELQAEIIRYTGFQPSQDLINSCERRHVPRSLLLLLSKLVCVNPDQRPTADKVRAALKKMSPEPSPSGTSGQIVQRGFGKLAGVFSDSFRTVNAADTRSRWEDDWQVSPVRSLPLPAGTRSGIERIATPVPTSLGSQSWTTDLLRLIRQYHTEIRAAVFVLKIMSLQPFVSGGKSPLAVFILLVLALFDLRGVSWAMSEIRPSVDPSML